MYKLPISVLARGDRHKKKLSETHAQKMFKKKKLYMDELFLFCYTLYSIESYKVQCLFEQIIPYTRKDRITVYGILVILQ